MFDEKQRVQKVGARTPAFSSELRTRETARTTLLGSIGGNRDQKAKQHVNGSKKPKQKT
jgi:hypothetical protein